MHKKKVYICIILSIFFINDLFSGQNNFNHYFIEAAKTAKASVVNITIYNKNDEGIKENYSKVAYGSGTIVSSDGFIVTNYHVIKKGNYYQIQSSDGSKFDLEKFPNGRFFLADPKTDIALLKIKNIDGIEFKPIDVADSNALNEGEWVIAIGNPYGLNQSITCGIVSSKGRDNIGFADIEDFIQTDVSINPGNSGGPLINLSGKLVGINTAIRSVSGGFQGISFAIPSSIVKQVCMELIKYGRVRRGWLGFLVKETKYYKNKDDLYVEIISVIKRSPAETAGLKKGDIIKEINGEKIKSLGGLIKSVNNKGIGSKISIIISRDAQLYDINLILREKRVYQKIREGLYELFSLYGIEIDENSEKNDIIISYITLECIAYGLKKGDIVISLNNKKVSSLESFIKIFYKDNKQISKMEIDRDSKIYQINF